MSQAEDRTNPLTFPERPSITGWREGRAKPAQSEAAPPAEAVAQKPPTNTLADRIHARQAQKPAATEQGKGEGEGSGGDEGQQQTVARTPLFTTLGVRSENAGQDIPTPKRKDDPMDRPAEDFGAQALAHAPPKKRKRGM